MYLMKSSILGFESMVDNIYISESAANERSDFLDKNSKGYGYIYNIYSGNTATA